LPLKWFRRKKPEDVAPLTRAPETPEPDHLTVREPAAAGDDGQSSSDAAAKKRRRGTRGGRNRKKTTATGATATGYTAGDIPFSGASVVDANNVSITLPAVPAANNWYYSIIG